MGFISWIKDALASKQQDVARTTQEQRPAHAKDWFAQEAAKEAASYKPINSLPESVKAAAVEAARPAVFEEKAGQHQAKAPGDEHDGTKGALMHNQSAQEKAQKAMSPTDAKRGHTRGRGMER